ncbi:MAG TPA: hypothetical protein VMG13_08825, partial [Trebonia sp.]|nr:hypothetical protein [Trebonia sp.]
LTDRPGAIGAAAPKTQGLVSRMNMSRADGGFFPRAPDQGLDFLGAISSRASAQRRSRSASE